MLPARPRGKVADDNKLGVVSHHKGIQVRRALTPPLPPRSRATHQPPRLPSPQTSSPFIVCSPLAFRKDMRQDKTGAGGAQSSAVDAHADARPGAVASASVDAACRRRRARSDPSLVQRRGETSFARYFFFLPPLASKWPQRPLPPSVPVPGYLTTTQRRPPTRPRPPAPPPPPPPTQNTSLPPLANPRESIYPPTIAYRLCARSARARSARCSW
jgi:hypothetical protein